ncbi:hypothetical protein ACFL3T_01585 [Patescibacteria group bacterium]
MASKTPDTPKYSAEDVDTKKVHLDDDYFFRRDVDFFRRALQRKFAKLLKSIETTDTFVEKINQTKALFPNPFLFDIAKCIAEASDNGESISAEEIAKKFKVDKKNVSNKMPFIREIFSLQRLTMRSFFKPDPNEKEIKRGENVVKPVFHQLVKY